MSTLEGLCRPCTLSHMNENWHKARSKESLEALRTADPTWRQHRRGGACTMLKHVNPCAHACRCTRLFQYRYPFARVRVSVPVSMGRPVECGSDTAALQASCQVTKCMYILIGTARARSQFAVLPHSHSTYLSPTSPSEAVDATVCAQRSTE